MAEVLKDLFQNYFQRRESGETKPNGEIILVVTDGQPDNRESVIREIVEATQRIDRDEELGISFIQIGNDPDAAAFLKALDGELQDLGAKFDIVDTITIQEIEEEALSLKEVLLKAIQD
jgi:hypothetical protein